MNTPHFLMLSYAVAGTTHFLMVPCWDIWPPDLAELHAVMRPGLTFDITPMVGPPPGCLGWQWG